MKLPKSTDTRRLGILHYEVYTISANVEMTLGANRCDQCMGPVDVVTESSGCDQWVGPVDMVTECFQWLVDMRTFYLIMKYLYSSNVSAFWQPHPYFLFNFCKLFFILERHSTAQMQGIMNVRAIHV